MVAVALLLLPSLVRARDGAAACAAEHYRLIPLPLKPTHLSGTGYVSGTTSAHLAAVWSQRHGLTVAPLPAGYTRAEGTGVDEQGRLIGDAMTSNSSQRQAFTFFEGKLDLLPGKQSKPFSINEAGMIAGEAVWPGSTGNSGPVVWQHGDVTSLGFCCGGTAMAVNDNAMIVGDTYDRQGRYHPFLWTKALAQERIEGTADYSSAVALNNAGDVLIQSLSTVLLFKDRNLTQIPLSPKFPNQAKAINDCPTVVGAFGRFSDAYRAFLWDTAMGFRDLNDLVTAPGWKLEMATGINKRGEIVGFGDQSGEEDRGFLLVPLAGMPAATR